MHQLLVGQLQKGRDHLHQKRNELSVGVVLSGYLGAERPIGEFHDEVEFVLVLVVEEVVEFDDVVVEEAGEALYFFQLLFDGEGVDCDLLDSIVGVFLFVLGTVD